MNIEQIEEYIEETYEVEDINLYVSEEMPVGGIAIGGLFCPVGGISFSLTINPDSEEITMQSEELIKEELELVYEHELRHAHQSEQRLFESSMYKMVGGDVTMNYYGDPDEIDAYGNVDLVAYVDKNGWHDAMTNKFSILKTYIDLFGMDSREVRNLIKKAYKVLM